MKKKDKNMNTIQEENNLDKYIDTFKLTLPIFIIIIYFGTLIFDYSIENIGLYALSSVTYLMFRFVLFVKESWDEA